MVPSGVLSCYLISEPCHVSLSLGAYDVICICLFLHKFILITNCCMQLRSRLHQPPSARAPTAPRPRSNRTAPAFLPYRACAPAVPRPRSYRTAPAFLPHRTRAPTAPRLRSRCTAPAINMLNKIDSYPQKKGPKWFTIPTFKYFFSDDRLKGFRVKA